MNFFTGCHGSTASSPEPACRVTKLPMLPTSRIVPVNAHWSSSATHLAYFLTPSSTFDMPVFGLVAALGS